MSAAAGHADESPPHPPGETPAAVVAPAGSGTATTGFVGAPAPPRSHVRFTGSGGEYFRIWVVNLLLTLASFGIYSAWAKVRKTRYFYQNTSVDGHAFDYHGAPLAILRGRMVAVVLLIAYTWSFDISRTLGLVTIAVLCLAGPWLFMKAQQFKFRNSSWRGLRFGFDSSLGVAYRTLLPLLLIWFSGTILSAFLVPEVLVLVGVLPGILLPLMHHTLKRYQHSRVSYGNVGAAFRPAVGRFYGVYIKALLLLSATVVVGSLLAFGASWGFNSLRATLGLEGHLNQQTTAMVIGGTVGAIGYMGVWPYFSTRLQQIVWGNTQLGLVHFETRIRAWPLLRLVLKCVLLTVLTLGLFWPYAAVALARYRIECMDVIAPAVLGDAVAEVAASTVATGEGAADLFGLDVGL